MTGEPPSGGPLGFGDDAVRAPEPAATTQHDSPAPPPVNTSKYTWFVGVAAIVLIAIVFINTLGNGPGPRGVKAGRLVPPFAAPLAMGNRQGDVNVATKPNEGSAGKVPACSIHDSAVFTVCDAYATRPLVLVFLGTRGGGCVSELDLVSHVASAYPRVGVAAVAIRGDRSDLRKLVVKHGWRFPVAYDRDGVLANRYGVAVCPQITYVRRGGRSAGTSFGQLDERGLRTRFAALGAGHVVPR